MAAPPALVALPVGCKVASGKWSGGLVAGADGALYAAPSCAEGVLRVDAAAGGTTSLVALPAGCDASRGSKWWGGLVAGADG
eukprot:COSAG01_NODE_38842_length_484_cov_1.251948_1_plen_81_part_01